MAVTTRGAAGWRGYYSVEDDAHSTDQWEVDDHLAELVGLEPPTFVREAIGVRWSRVEDAPLTSASTLPHIGGRVWNGPGDPFVGRIWFASGDPWTVLVGVGVGDLLVGTPLLFEGGMAGPASVTMETIIAEVRIPVLDARAFGEAVATADKETRRRLWRCPLCREPRYAKGCRCNGAALGIQYD